MALSPYVNFNGDRSEAVDFCGKVFGTAAPRIMTLGVSILVCVWRGSAILHVLQRRKAEPAGTATGSV
jgi:hypothetical protein